MEVAAFQNTRIFDLHQDFLRTVFPDQFEGLTTTQYNNLVGFRASREYFVGTISRLRSAEGYRYGFSVFALWSDPAEALASGLEADGHVRVDGLLFALDQADLLPGSETALQAVAELLELNSGMSLYVVGHTDSSGAATSHGR